MGKYFGHSGSSLVCTAIVGNDNILSVITMNFGLSIAKIRMDRGISQADLARQAGISQSTVSDIESGKTDPRVSTALKLLYLLDIRYMEIVSNGKHYGLRPVMHTRPGADRKVFEEAIDCLTAIRGWAQLAVEQVERESFPLSRQTLGQLRLLIDEADRLAQILGSGYRKKSRR